MKIIKYKTGQYINLEKELDKIWDDHLSENPNYKISLINIDILDKPIIKNAYSYQIKNDKIFYSILTSAKFKEKIFKQYEKIIGINIYDFKLIDDHTYMVNYYNNMPINYNNIIKIINQVKNFKNYKYINRSNIKILDNFIYKSLQYNNITELKIFYKNNKEVLYNSQTFSQGNCQLERILQFDNNLFFDYFSIYEKPFYSSYLLDLGQLLVSIYNNNNLIKLEKMKLISKILNDKDRKLIIFLSLIQEEITKELKKLLLNLIKKD